MSRWLAFLCLLLPAASGRARADLPLPDAPALLQRMVARAAAVGSETNTLVHQFTKTSWYEKLDAAGNVTSVREKLYEVTLQRGLPHNRLVALDGRPLGPDESEQRNESERKVRNRFSASGSDRADEGVSALINDGLVARFEFTVAGREEVAGRPAVLLRFRPRSGPLPNERLADRVINLLHGTVWVDEAEAEVVRALVRTEGALRLWGGFLGALDRLEFHIDRARSPAGAWYNRQGLFLLRGRKLWETVHFRAREVAGEIREVPPAPALRADGR
ncbi:MAG TPA: hypothetical protein PKE47_07890 [Verrucomicrobiota bacterium]|nr:hypothetical protein [Verrucomicrobiota bacterium]